MKSKSKITSFFNALFVNARHFSLVSKVGVLIKKMNSSERMVFYAISIIMLVSGMVLLIKVNNFFTVEIPAFGGKFTEGVIGSPRFINPILAISDTDKDLSALIYSGLMKNSEESGLEPDLAENYEIQENGTVYYVKLKEGIYFHDGERITADDIIFTIGKAIDPIIKSPKKSNWEGVTVEKISDTEIKFILKKPYSPFLQFLTLGIIPKHIWEDVSSEEFPFSEFNINPIGSGLYKVEKITRNSGGIPNTITLSAWKKYQPKKANIKSVIFKFFQNEKDLIEAFKNKTIESTAKLNPSDIGIEKENLETVISVELPRVFGVFFNQNVAPVFLNQEVREALSLATPKNKIIEEALLSLGKPLNGPTPENIEEDKNNSEGNAAAAKELLLSKGWTENEQGILEKINKKEKIVLSFSISTSDAPELKRTAEILAENWKQIGAEITVKVFESGDLNQNIIKPRKYDALLFGEVINQDGDLYPFWHSSERNDPGLNVALYANIEVDKALEDLRTETDIQQQAEKRQKVFSEIQKDIPAIFLFTPYFSYIKPPEAKNVTLKQVSSLSERFSFINKWFIETDKVWKIFAN